MVYQVRLFFRVWPRLMDPERGWRAIYHNGVSFAEIAADRCALFQSGCDIALLTCVVGSVFRD